MALRIVFFGTPDFAVPTLGEIIGQGHDVAAVYTQPPRAAGRGLGERRSPVHDVATRFGIPVMTPASLRTDEAAAGCRSYPTNIRSLKASDAHT